LIYDHARLLQVYPVRNGATGLVAYRSHPSLSAPAQGFHFKFSSDDIQIDNLRSLGYSAHSSNAN